jgi:hypothetical protein
MTHLPADADPSASGNTDSAAGSKPDNAGSARQLSTVVIEPQGARARARRIAIVAAALSIAAALGSVFGALAGSALSRPAPEPALNAKAANERMAQLSVEIATLKADIENANRSTGAQLSRMTERIDRSEKAQAEPAARIAKISEAIERIERKSVASADVTGSIVPKQQDRPPVVEGWVLREIEDGRALVQSRLGYFEVGPGSNLPGLGRVEGIKREDGRWVVVTAKGHIVSPAARR